MFNILAPYAYFAPEQAASSYLWQNLHEDFAKADMDCVVYVPTPTRGISPDVRKEYKQKYAVEQKYNGRLTIVRFLLYGEGTNPLMRALRYFFSCGIQFCKCMWGKEARNCNVMFLTSTPPILGLVASFVKIFRGIPFVYNLQDIFPDSLVGTSLTKKGSLLWKIGRVVENFTYKHADKIIVISEDFKKNIMAKGVPEDKIEVVYNWVDQNAVVHVDRSENKLIGKYNIDPTKFYIEYSGNIGLTQNMDMLLDVMKDLKTSYPEIGLILVGEGAYRQQVEEIVKRDSLTNVIMLPFQPYEDISHVFSLGDVGIIISKPGVGSNSVPSKTWSIMSASRPVLANFDENEIKSILSDNNCGIFTKAGDKDAFKNAIIKLYENRDLCKEYGRNGREFIMKNLTREVGTQKYVDVIKSVVK